MPAILPSLILVVTLLYSPQMSIAKEELKKIEQFASPVERQGELIRNLRSYEIDFPIITDNDKSHLGYLTNGASRRRRRRAINTVGKHDPFHYKFRANGEDHYMKLRMNTDLFGPAFKVEHFYGDDDVGNNKMEDHCYLVGETFPKNYRVAISDCDGLFGMVATEGDLLYIEPLVNDSHVDKEKLKGAGRPHLIYKHSDLPKVDQRFDEFDITRIAAANAPQAPGKKRHGRSYVTFYNKSGRIVKLIWIDEHRKNDYDTIMPGRSVSVSTYTSNTWIAVDEATGINLMLGHKMEYVPTRNYRWTRAKVHIKLPRDVSLPKMSQDEIRKSIGSKYIESMVVADKSVVDFHGKEKAGRYIMALMNIVSYIFKHKSLVLDVHYIIVRLVLLHKHPKEVVFNPKREYTSISTACDFMLKIRKGRTDDDPRFHDHAIYLSRRPFGRAAGYAPLDGMCHPTKSCGLVSEDGFSSAFIIAHEVGHSLGMNHDGRGNDCRQDTYDGSVMAPVVKSRMNRYFWSRCSQNAIIGNIKKYRCLNDKPGKEHKKELPSVHKYPGFHYSADEQCRFEYGDGYSWCDLIGNFPKTACPELYCKKPVPYDNYCVTLREPALNGTACGAGKWCLNGKCTEKDAEDLPKPIDGKWSTWGAWEPCSKDCGVGIRSRTRQCNNPIPRYGGKDCVGNAMEKEICNTKTCEHTVFLHADEIKKQCNLVGKQRRSPATWSYYDENKVDLDCNFEKNLCSWINVAGTDRHDWTLNRGRTATHGTGPSVDHTTNSARGQYIFFESSSPAKKGDKARLSSPDMAVRRGCLSFWYHILGTGSIGTLRVLTINRKDSKTLWSRNENEGDKWIETHIDIQHEGVYRLVIEAERADGYRSDFAVDDITFAPGPCQKGNSNVDEDSVVNPCVVTCESRGSKNKIHVNTPVVDGLRCYDNASLDVCIGGKCRNVGCDGVLDSKKEYDNCGVCGGDGSLCRREVEKLTITPNRHHEHLLNIPKGSANIKVTKSPNSEYLLVLAVKDSKGSGRKIKVINAGRRLSSPAIYSTNGNQFVYMNKNGEETISSLGMVKQDVSISIKVHGNQRTRSPVAIQCEYFATKKAVSPSVPRPKTRLGAEQKDYLRWVITDRWTHCTRSCGKGNSFLIYFCKRGDKIVPRFNCKHLELKVVQKYKPCNTQPCETYNWEKGSWSACSKTCSVGLTSREVTCRKQPGNTVVSASFCKDVRPTSTKTCLVKACPSQWSTGSWSECSATCGLGVQTRDVFCTNERKQRTNGCEKNERPESRRTCQRPACPKDDTDSLSCDFEKDLCDWTQMSDDDFDWTRNSGKTNSVNTGPINDHTLKNHEGHYLYIETSSPRRPHHKARLTSPEMTAQRACLKFYYHMYGSHIGKLKVKLLTKDGYVNSFVWKKHGDHGNKWFEAQVDISMSRSYKIVIEAICGKSWRGDIAIDDITFHKTTCAEATKGKRIFARLR